MNGDFPPAQRRSRGPIRDGRRRLPSIDTEQPQNSSTATTPSTTHTVLPQRPASAVRSAGSATTPVQAKPQRAPAAPTTAGSSSQGGSATTGARAPAQDPQAKARAAIKNWSPPVDPLPLSTPFIRTAITNLNLAQRQAKLEEALKSSGVAQDGGDIKNNVLFVIPTKNQDKCELLFNFARASQQQSAPQVHLVLKTNTPAEPWYKVPAKSDAGEQPFESAGPVGAHMRALNALEALFTQPAHVKFLQQHNVGTVVVGSVENFFVRPERLPNESVVQARAAAWKGGPADFGFVVFCRVRLGRQPSWAWKRAVSKGAPVPREYLELAEAEGFDDKARAHGKVTLGRKIAEKTGLSEGNWHLHVVGVSRYDLLREAMATVHIPW